MAIALTRPLGAGYGATRLLRTLSSQVSAWNDARVTRNALNRLSDRELSDMGLVRGDIDAIADGV